MRNDPVVVLAAVREKGIVLRHAGDVIKNDQDVVLAAVQQDRDALQYVS